MEQQNNIDGLFQALGLDPGEASTLSGLWGQINGSNNAVDPAKFEPSRNAQWWNPFSWGVGGRERKQNRDAWYKGGEETQALTSNVFNTVLGTALSNQGLVKQAEVLSGLQQQIEKGKLAGELQKTKAQIQAQLQERGLINDNNIDVQNLVNEGLIAGKNLDLEGTKHIANKQYDLGVYQTDAEMANAAAQRDAENARFMNELATKRLAGDQNYMSNLLAGLGSVAWRG